jgi:hypothetical protein
LKSPKEKRMHGYGSAGALWPATALGIVTGQSWVILVAVLAILLPAFATRLLWRRRRGAFDA